MRASVLALVVSMLASGDAHSQTLTTYLSDLTERYATIGWGTIRKDLSVSGTPLRLNGVTYGKGIGTHAISDIRYDLAGGCSRFDAVVGVDDAVALGSIRFQVYADNALIFDSLPRIGGPMTGAHPGLRVSVDVTGKRDLRLFVSDSGNGIGKDHADWGDARVTCTAGALSPLRRTSYLSDLTATSATIGWGTIRKDVDVTGTPLTLNGVVYAKGIGTHAISEIHYNLAGACSRFDAVVGVDDAVTRGSIRFQVFADGRFLYDSYSAVAGNMTGAHPGQPVSVELSATQDLKLLVTDGGDGIGSDHADWANARVTCAPGTAPPPPDSTISFLSDLTSTYATTGWGTIRQDRSVEGNPLRLGGVTYAKGIGTHAVSDIRYTLAGRCSRFQAVVGVDDEMTTKGSVNFQVYGDGVLLFDSGRLTFSDPGRAISLDLSGRQQVRLYVTNGGSTEVNPLAGDHADWADARVTCSVTPPPPPPPPPDTETITATFAYWNVYGGNGVPHLNVTNFRNPEQPFACTSAAGEPLDDSAYGTGTGAAMRQVDAAGNRVGAMAQTLVQQIVKDSTVVAIGLGEAWGGADPSAVLPLLGWSRSNATSQNFGDIILTRYGFREQGMSAPIGQSGTEVHRALYADVCLNAGCTSTLPFFVVHTQAPQDGTYAGNMRTLLAYVASMVPDGRPRIIIGDFNAWDTLTDPHICASNVEPGPSHEEGIRFIMASGYTDVMRLKNPTGNRYTGMLNRPVYNNSSTSCTIRAGLPQGHPFKAIDHAYAKYLASANILAAQPFGVPVGGYGNCAASDHLGVKVSIRAPAAP